MAEPRMAHPLVPRVAHVRRRWRDGPDVWTLEIEDGAGSGFMPGQFNMLTVFGVGEVPISLSGDPADGNRIRHTVRAVGPVTRALARLRPGDPLGLRGPFGTGWPTDALDGRDVVIVAGGLGLAPLRPAILQLLARRDRIGRLTLVYGARSPDQILFARQQDRWGRRSDIEVAVTVDHATSPWRGYVGVVTTLIPRAVSDPANTVALVCGPEIMMRFAAAALTDAGLPETAIHLSMERNMKCAVGLCGHCQFGADFLCRDGPVFRLDRIARRLALREI
ncbi:FAD/NAD(P)-binding protein [Jhaorihella thermophila]|nr:FAD/NAD(P)-binding protein [Jhaorihella thermophila]